MDILFDDVLAGVVVRGFVTAVSDFEAHLGHEQRFPT